MRKMFVLAGLVTLICVGPLQAAPITVYDNGAPDQVFGTQMSEFQVAENFTLGSAANVTNIRFWTIQSDPSDYSGSISWAFYADAAGSIGSLISGATQAVAATPTGGSTGFGYLEYVFNVNVNVALGAGNYWLGLHNGPLSNTTATEMLWGTTTNQVGSYGLYFDPSTSVNAWVNSGNEHAFLLQGPDAVSEVPEPATLALCLVGFAAVALRRRLAK